MPARCAYLHSNDDIKMRLRELHDAMRLSHQGAEGADAYRAAFL